MTTETQIPDTDDVIKDMLTENTGRALCDSGGAYGRHWEENQDRDFEDEDPYDVHLTGFEGGTFSADVTLNVYHFLATFLEFDKRSHELNKQFREYAKRDGNEDEAWLTLMEEWTGGSAVNTYNQETILSQTLQYVPFRMNEGKPEDVDLYDTEFILLQIHNGCDVRGGYTAPVVFRMVGSIDYWYMKMSEASAYVENRPCAWDSRDCGYRWESAMFEGSHEFDKVTYDPDLDILYCKGCVQDEEIKQRRAGDFDGIEQLKKENQVQFYAEPTY